MAQPKPAGPADPHLRAALEELAELIVVDVLAQERDEGEDADEGTRLTRRNQRQQGI